MNNPCTTAKPLYIVKESAAPNKSSWKWRHCRVNVAVLETDGREHVAMISARARGVRKIVWYRGGLFDGRSLRCQASRARFRAERVAARLNAAVERECSGRGACACE